MSSFPINQTSHCIGVLDFEGNSRKVTVLIKKSMLGHRASRPEQNCLCEVKQNKNYKVFWNIQFKPVSSVGNNYAKFRTEKIFRMLLAGGSQPQSSYSAEGNLSILYLSFSDE
ncbi:hypothetical protein IRJ41_007572 [Triplophysa rosa]|uniref:Uncharacterized protein n=1 Tax=Triplophysa rosa TaxID=992332 RepID=A0A9W7WUE4_TRIRA|nr:hypothetical protein IRJ41_007572 [Triplophysa rosa]